MKKNLILILISIGFTFITNAQSRLKAEIYAQNAAEQIKDSYTPFTGKNVRSEIQDMEFDIAENEYIIKMYAIWDARGCALCYTKEHRISGILMYNPKTKSTKFKTLSKNSAVVSTEKYIKATGFVIDAIIILKKIE